MRNKGYPQPSEPPFSVCQPMGWDGRLSPHVLMLLVTHHPAPSGSCLEASGRRSKLWGDWVTPACTLFLDVSFDVLFPDQDHM